MSFFTNDKKIYSASAPGRLDVMGGISDYSGSLLLEMPIAKTLAVEMQQRDDSMICIRSVIDKKNKKEFQIDHAMLMNKEPGKAGEMIRAMEGGDWASYVIGCILILEKEKEIEIGGVNILIRSDIPIGKGVASSAALEVATLNGLCKMCGLRLDEIELPVIAQKAENKIAGAACGLMDQLTVHLGKKNKLLPIICQPHKVFSPVAIPKGIQFFGIDSGVRHAVGGATYAQVRTATFMGYTVIATIEGASINEMKWARQKNNFTSLPWGGWLANIPVSVFEQKYAAVIPEEMPGDEFLEKYQSTIDDATQVLPGVNYKLLACTRHPVHENFRVHLFSQLLQQFPKSGDKTTALKMLGELMYQSHMSYTSVGLGNDATDEIVDLIKRSGAESGVFGARVTGGGSGGTVVALCYGKEGKQSIKNIYNNYKKSSGKKLYLFSGSRDGAMMLNNKHNTKRHEYNSAV